MSANATTENPELESFIETGDDEDSKMILGDSTRIFYSGIVRAGVKVPKNTCTAEEKKKFKELEDKGLPYDEIDKAIGGTPKSSKSKLFPANADYFVLRDCDFKNPADAQFIRDNFADPKDGKVRRIPVWLTSGNIEDAIPHNYNAFDGAANIRAYSFFDKDDNQMLKYVPNSVTGQPTKNDWVTVPFENPDKPPADAPTGIKFGGNYKVNIKGIKGAGEIKVAIRSWYGIRNSIAVLRKVRSVLGRFNNLMNGEPFLVLEKVQETVKSPDGKHLKQWITTINAAVDMADLAEYAENRAMRGFAALNQFNGQRSTAATSSAPAVTSAQSAAPAEPVTTKPAPPLASAAKSAPSAPAAEKKEVQKPAAPAKEAQETATAAPSTDAADDKERQDIIDNLYKMAAAAGLTDLELEAYGNFKLKMPICNEKDTGRLKKLVGELDMRLKANKDAVKARCQELLAGAQQSALSAVTARSNDPEVDGMLNEFERLADNNDLPRIHVIAHLIALSGITEPAQMTLAQLQWAYKEVEARIKRCGGKLDELKKEFAGNYAELTKKAA